uniref:RING-type E3 ubiquitin transferase n=1 Tax=Naja naja TaxID=35670 RepID=A0A8C6XJS2_NAJNA
THFYGGKKVDRFTLLFYTQLESFFLNPSLSLQPFEYPVCTPDGTIFDLLNIVPWIKKYGTNPSTGESCLCFIPLPSSFFNLGKYHCPVLFTVFTNNSHIVAIKTTGNVFGFEAVEQLNIKTKTFKDLLSDEPFSRQDIITLQDPTNVDKFNVSSFFHVKNNLKVTDPDDEKARSDPSYYLKNANIETRETLLELYKEFKGDDILAATMKEPEKKKTDRLNAAHYSTGRVSASFTSTAMAPETTHEAAAIDDDVVRYRYVKKKGYVRLHTSQGNLNLELHCDMVRSELARYSWLPTGLYSVACLKPLFGFFFWKIDLSPFTFSKVAQEREKAQQEEETTKRESKEVPKKEPPTPKTYRTGVGKYINIAAAKRAAEEGPSTSGVAKKEKKTGGFGDFSSW